MPRKQKKYHFIYKTTCKVTENYYYGMHSTDNLDDGYLGSGTRISRSIKKYGPENHSIEKLEFLPNRKKLKEREAEIVNEDLINDPLCMNLQTGGGGGFINEEHRLKCTLAGNKKRGKIRAEKGKELFSNKEWAKNFSEAVKKGIKNRKPSKGMLGKTHSLETKEKMSNAHKDYNNSQYGTCWITNEKENKKIYKGDLIPKGWRLGRKMK